MNRSVRPFLVFAASVAVFAVQPAAADDGRRHVMPATQKIDLVRDLPNSPAFERDGEYFDLGYIYPVHTVNGASVASTGGDAGYVLYHDDKYIKVDASLMADLRFALGDEDPTQGYTPPTPSSSRANAAAADPWGANGNADSARGQPVVSSPPRRSSSARSVGVIGTAFLFFLVLFLRLRVFRDLVIGGVLAAIAGIARGKGEPGFVPGERGSIDTTAQAATQRARLDALSGAPTSTPVGAQGGFGRKGL